MGSGHGDPGLNFVGVLLLAALGTFVWNATPPLDSARPTSASSEEWTHHELSVHIPARLWQDPFTVMERYFRTKGTSSGPPTSPGEDLPTALEDHITHGNVIVLAVMLDPGIYPALVERRRQRRYAVLSGLAESGFVPKDAGGLYVFRMGWPKPLGKGPSDNKCSSRAPVSGCPQLNIPYEWYTNDGFDRTDTAKPSQKTVLVLWLDEGRFKDDFFGHFKQLLLALLRPTPDPNPDARPEPVDTVVLGPAGSATLRKMVREPDSDAIKWITGDSNLNSFTILSPTATAADRYLLPDNDGTPTRAHVSSQDGIGLAQRFDNVFDGSTKSYRLRTKMRFVRTIHSDNALLASLWNELTTKRGFTIGRDTALVMSEWDTLFGRALQEGFATYDKSATPTRSSAFCRTQEAGSAKNSNPFLLRYTYQRGIDGIVPGTHVEKAKDDTERKNGQSADSTPGEPFLLTRPANVRRPVGTGQYDYLRRLAVVVRNEDRRRRLEFGTGIRVAAVLGSDVYDKLLILHALRFELPGSIWLTTDLDANLLHPSDFGAARNMIVASTYGLRLRASYQGRTAPFRDSYQTSVFLSTRLAVDNTIRHCIWPYFEEENSAQLQTQFYEAVPVRLFEVGRQTFVPLWTSPSDSGATCGSHCLNDVVRFSYFRPIATAGLLLGFVGIIVLYATRPRSTRLAVVLSLALAAFAAIIGVSWLIPDEPHLLTAGVSVWPTEYIRTAAIIVTCLFFWSTCERLSNNWVTLNRRYFCAPPHSPSEMDDPISLSGVARRTWDDICSMRRCSRFCAVVLALFLPAVVLIMFWLPFVVGAVSRKLAVHDIWVRILLPFLVWMLINGLWCGLTRPKKRKWLHAVIGWRLARSLSVRSIIRWDSKRISGNERKQQMDALWHDYGKYGQIRHRLLRCSGYTLLYLWITSIVFAVFGWTPAPGRGAATIAVDHIMTVVSVVLMVFLLFFVVDSIRLCVVWISLIRKYGSRWPDGTARRHGVRHRLSRTDEAGAWLTVHLIGERTAEVSRTIYYPILVILMLLAARSSYFTNWAFPQSLAIVIGLYFVIAVGSAVYLGYEARAARRDVIDRLQTQDSGHYANISLGKGDPKTLEALVSELEQLKIGAYQRLLDQPTVRATLLVLGGIGLTYAQYLPLH